MRKTRPTPATRHKPTSRPSASAYEIDPETVFEDLVKGLRTGTDDFAWGCCPFHDDQNPSFCVNLITGWYRCVSTSCGASGTSIVGFVGHLFGLDRREAIEYLEDHYV